MLNVFIADDSALMRQRMIALLSELPGLNIIAQATNKQEALKSISKYKPDVAILDIRMPGGSGIDVLKYIKKYYPSSCVIMFTNYPFNQYRKKCKEAGADFFFDKSSEFEKLVEILRNFHVPNCHE